MTKELDMPFDDPTESQELNKLVNKLDEEVSEAANFESDFKVVPRIPQNKNKDTDKTFREKYRPQKLEELVATCPKEMLRNQIGNPGASQIFLLEGATGTGKTTCARILAKAANCLTSNNLDKPCLACENCKSYETSFDKIQINSANYNKIEDIRKLVEDMRYAPTIYEKKIYILDEVQRLTADAQQVLLTEFEEPYSHLLVFLCTTNIKKIDKALVDRACTINFKPLTPLQASNLTRQVLIYESLEADDDTIEQLYNCSDGSVRALLNNIEAYKQQGFDPKKWEFDETPIEVKSLFQVINKGDWPGLSKLLRRPNVRKEPERLRLGLENYIRAVILHQASEKDASKLGQAMDSITGSLREEPSVSQYNLFVLKCLQACVAVS